ncbi:MAG: UDP-N-acetylmuramoyl-L-alanine--D-glutamate ligase [bacterium]|nr:UDP-N-acetylmuramoyl-L-alanine--D-glutamate ligase [bacterium]
MKVAILGFAREGKSLLKFLKKQPQFKKGPIDILDKKRDKNYLKNLYKYDLVFRSPGMPYNLPQIQKAIKNGTEVASITKLFFDLCPAKIIGITGTKGKGTTSTLLYKILKAAGYDVQLAGNIGKPSIDILSKLDRKSLAILELSSFQLQDLDKSPTIAVVLDIFPDHMDVHKNMAEYTSAKSNICRHQKTNDKVFYFADNKLSKKIALKSRGKKIAITAPDDLSKNNIMAAAVAKNLGCPAEIIARTIKNFHGLEHRMELARTITLTKQHSHILPPSREATDGRGENVRMLFYNDSASTNPQTAAKAILSLSNNNSATILIAGGKDKGLDYTPLAHATKKAGNVKSIILFGENKNKIKRALMGNKKLDIKTAKSLEGAVKLAFSATRSLIANNQLLITILFSPASASFDMFTDYADRGQRFKNIVKQIKT